MADFSKNPVKKPQINVIFWKIEESYLINTDVTVHYSIANGLETSSRDWIGLYRVGWRSHLDYVYYEWSSEGKDNSKTERKVVFPAKKLPKDSEFYQFCYVTSSGKVQGASTPFQFKSIIVDEFVEDEDEKNGMVMIKTKTTYLEDNLEKANDVITGLKKQIEKFESDIQTISISEDLLKNLLQVAEQERNKLMVLLEETNENLSDQIQANGHLQDCIKGFHEKIEVLEQEKHSMEKRLDDSDLYVASLQDKIKALVTEKDALLGHVRSLEEQLTTSLAAAFKEQDVLKMKLAEEESKSSAYKKDLENYAQILSAAKKDSTESKRLASLYKNDRDCLIEKLDNSTGMLDAAESSKKVLNAEVLSIKTMLEKSELKFKNLQEELDASHRNFNASKLKHDKEIKFYINREQQQDSLIEELNKAVDKLKNRCDKLEKELEAAKLPKETDPCGSVYALQVSHDTLVKRYGDLTKTFEAQTKEKEILNREQIKLIKENSELKSENVKLKERMAACQVAYRRIQDECEQLKNSRNGGGGYKDVSTELEGYSNDKVRKYKKMLWENADKCEKLSKLLEEKERQITQLKDVLYASREEEIKRENSLSELSKDDAVEEYLECLKHVEGLTLCQHCHLSIDDCDEDLIRSHLEDHQREGSINSCY